VVIFNYVLDMVPHFFSEEDIGLKHASLIIFVNIKIIFYYYNYYVTIMLLVLLFYFNF